MSTWCSEKSQHSLSPVSTGRSNQLQQTSPALQRMWKFISWLSQMENYPLSSDQRPLKEIKFSLKFLFCLCMFHPTPVSQCLKFWVRLTQVSPNVRKIKLRSVYCTRHASSFLLPFLSSPIPTVQAKAIIILIWSKSSYINIYFGPDSLFAALV